MMMTPGLGGWAGADRMNFPRNLVANNTMQGGSGGSPGTSPTGWAMDGDENGLSRTLAFGTDGWIDYVDARWAGTTSAGSWISIGLGAVADIAAVNGDALTFSAYLKLQAGSWSGTTNKQMALVEYNGAEAWQKSNVTSSNVPDGTLTRYEYSATLSDADTAYARAEMFIFYSNAEAVDFTLRFGLPQVNRGSAATPAMKTFG